MSSADSDPAWFVMYALLVIGTAHVRIRENMAWGFQIARGR
jgi:hypothetical protein